MKELITNLSEKLFNVEVKNIIRSGKDGKYRIQDQNGKSDIMFVVEKDHIRWHDFRSGETVFTNKTGKKIDKVEKEDIPAKPQYSIASLVWSKLKFDDSEPVVLREKGLKDLLKLNKDGVAHFPFYKDFDKKKVVGFQYRKPESHNLAYPTSPLKGSFCILQESPTNDLIDQEIICICESVTTGLELAEALPDCTVVASSGMSTLASVDKAVSKLKSAFIFFAGDRLTGKESKRARDNHIRTYGPLLKRHLVTPIDKGDITDFNDMAIRYGKLYVAHYLRKRLLSILPLAPQVIDYGDGVMSVFSHVLGKVEKFRLSQINYNNSQLASPAFFKDLKNRTLFSSSEEGSVNLLRDYFVSQSRDSNVTSVYGTGIFLNGKGKILNSSFGQFTVQDDEVKPFFNIRTDDGKFLQKKFSNFDNNFCQGGPFTQAEWDNYLAKFNELYELDPLKLDLFFGFLVQACMTGLEIDETAGLWLTGFSHVGKSTLGIRIISQRLLKGFCSAASQRTEASILQELTDDSGVINSYPIICDEAALDSASKRDRMENIITLFRSMLLTAKPKFDRGSSDFKRRTFTAKAAPIFMCAELPVLSVEDLSRYWNLNLVKSVSTKDQELFEDVYELSEKVRGKFLYTTLLSSQHFRAYMAKIRDRFKNKHSSHYPTTLSLCLAGAASFRRALDKHFNLQAFVDEREEKMTKLIDDFSNEGNSNNNLIIDLLRVQIKIGEFDGRLSTALTIRGLKEEILKLYGLKYWNNKLYFGMKKEAFYMDRMAEVVKHPTMKIKNFFKTFRTNLQVFAELNPDRCRLTPMKLRGFSERVMRINLDNREQLII